MTNHLVQDWVQAIPTFDTLTFFYGMGGNVLVEISEFDPTSSGIVLLERSYDGGHRWGPCNGTKLGRGIITNCCDASGSPAQFRVALEKDCSTPGFRVRVRDTREMQPVVVRVTFGGRIWMHSLRSESKYVITEEPDKRDLTH